MSCPLHHAECRPGNPRHDDEHRTERSLVKLVHIYGGPPAQPLTVAQQAVYDYLDRLPYPPPPLQQIPHPPLRPPL